MPKEQKPRQTRLSAAIRAAVSGRPVDFFVGHALRCAMDLDRTVIALGTKGEAVKGLAAYRQAATVYKQITGVDFV